MSDAILDQDIRKELGVEALPVAEQEAFIEQIGKIVIDTTLAELQAGLNEEQVSALEHYLDTEPEASALLEHLLKQYPQFAELLATATKDLKTEIVEALQAFK